MLFHRKVEKPAENQPMDQECVCTALLHLVAASDLLLSINGSALENSTFDDGQNTVPDPVFVNVRDFFGNVA